MFSISLPCDIEKKHRYLSFGVSRMSAPVKVAAADTGVVELLGLDF